MTSQIRRTIVADNKLAYYTKDMVALIEIICEIKDSNELKNLLKDLLTYNEMKELSNRWRVANLLYQKTPYSKIERETGMSSTTIARVSKAVKKGKGLKSVLKKMLVKRS